MSFFYQPIRALGLALLAALLGLPATSAMAREDWRLCANEGQECRVQGTATVRYGAPGHWETRRISHRVFCSNDQFGDPAPNREKRCEVLVDGGGGWGGSGSSGGWNDCANEGEVCTFRGRAEVRFGDGRKFNTRTARNSIRCDVATFGDPAYGKTKRCQVKGVSTGGGGWGGSGGSNDGNRPSYEDVYKRQGQQFARAGVQSGIARFGQLQHGVLRAIARGVVFVQHARAFAQLLQFTRQARLFAGTALVGAHGVGNVGQVTHTARRDDRHLVRAVARGHHGQAALAQLQAQRGQARQQRLVQRGHAVVVEAAGHGAEHGHRLRHHPEGLLAALHLLGHVAQRVDAALAVELVDRCV